MPFSTVNIGTTGNSDLKGVARIGLNATVWRQCAVDVSEFDCDADEVKSNCARMSVCTEDRTVTASLQISNVQVNATESSAGEARHASDVGLLPAGEDVESEKKIFSSVNVNEESSGERFPRMALAAAQTAVERIKLRQARAVLDLERTRLHEQLAAMYETECAELVARYRRAFHLLGAMHEIEVMKCARGKFHELDERQAKEHETLFEMQEEKLEELDAKYRNIFVNIVMCSPIPYNAFSRRSRKIVESILLPGTNYGCPYYRVPTSRRGKDIMESNVPEDTMDELDSSGPGGATSTIVSDPSTEEEGEFEWSPDHRRRAYKMLAKDATDTKGRVVKRARSRQFIHRRSPLSEASDEVEESGDYSLNLCSNDDATDLHCDLTV